MYMTVRQAAQKWNVSDSRVRKLCKEGKISGAAREGRNWMIPTNAERPNDERFKKTESLLNTIDRKKKELDTRRPLTKGELERLTGEFIVEYTYNSNAIEGNTLPCARRKWQNWTISCKFRINESRISTD